MHIINAAYRNLFPALRYWAGKRLFEMAIHNLRRETRRADDFLTYTARNPLKRFDSQK